MQEEILGVDFDALRISVASPDEIMAWSHGEILKPETINYRTQKPERDGLFDEKIFGPTKDYECYCGKYKKIRYKGIICEKCGVEVTKAAVRRERMGHIDLAVPIAHIWYVRGIPSIISLVLDMSVSDLEKIIYFASFIVLDVNEQVRKEALEQLEHDYNQLIGQKTLVKEGQPEQKEDEEKAKGKEQLAQIEAAYKMLKCEILALKPKRIITEDKYQDLSLKYGQIIKVGIGAEAIYRLLSDLNLDDEIEILKNNAKKGVLSFRKKVLRRLRLIEDMKKAKILPQWLILQKLPVIPPDLRPMVQLDGGRYAASDLNDLYRRVINRNHRLKKLLVQGAPEVICRNEKRMLQEAVDALIDNSARRGKTAVTTGGARKLRSLSDILRGKQGRFRQNLLGKRVDYSGRSVIVIGPHLKLNQCGLPKMMALELFKTFVISRLISEGYVHNVKNATRLIEQGTPEVWDILEKITKDYYVMLNRAPTLHRLGIQAFQPVLIEGKAIQIHPLVCSAFNADFDGDQMAVHVPLSSQARYETSNIMRSSHNVLKPASGEPTVTPRLDIVFGCFYMTTWQPGAKGEKKYFASKNEAIYAYQMGYVHLCAKIYVRMSAQQFAGKQGETVIVETSIGRILFNNVLPEEMRFRNQDMDDKHLRAIISECFKKYGIDEAVALVDRIKKVGFQYATQSGMTISIEDVVIPKQKKDILKQSNLQIDEIAKQFKRGLITDTERVASAVELWTKTKDKIEKEMIEDMNERNPVYMMVKSGARGSFAQVTQLGGMKGLVVNPAGEIIEIPIINNYKEGLNVLEYFISTHGARKGKSDTSLRTSDAGYLTRRLVDVAQDLVISEKDCLTNEGVKITREESSKLNQNFKDRILGRIALKNIKNPQSNKIICKAGEEISEIVVEEIEKVSIEQVEVRSSLGCLSNWGICQACYGRDLARGGLVQFGEAVGIVAAQAIGEPGTQLTMKTFHLGGVSGEDITTGLPRVEELFEARTPRFPAVLSDLNGICQIKKEKNRVKIIITSSEFPSIVVKIPEHYKLIIKAQDVVLHKQVIAISEGQKAIRATIAGKVKVEKSQIKITSVEQLSREYLLPIAVDLRVENGQRVSIGDQLTEGHWDLAEALKLKGKEAVEKYIIGEVQEIYSSQGQRINDKHIEIIIRQMFSKDKIISEGDTQLLPGQFVDITSLRKINESLPPTAKKTIAVQAIMGITRISLKTDSFLSAASFQETTGVLIDAAVRGAVDRLKGLKENVIIGRLIPAGTGFRKDIPGKKMQNEK